jgi:hypothetical protein
LVASPETTLEPLPDPPPILDTTVSIPPRSNVVASLILSLMNKRWEKKHLRFDEEDMRKMHAAFWARNDLVHVVARELDQAMTTTLVERCRNERVTVNSALWNALLTAQDEVQSGSPGYRHHGAMAVSTRDKLRVPVGEALGFYASSLSVKLPFSPELSFWDSTRRVHRAIRKELARTNLFRMLVANAIHPTLCDALYFDKYGLIDEWLPKKLVRKLGWQDLSYGYALTNVGRLDLPTRYGPLHLTSIFGPAFHSDVEEKVVGATTVGGKLSLILSCNERNCDAVTAKRLSDAIITTLVRSVS